MAGPCRASSGDREVWVLDYGAGNVRSLRNAIHKLGFTIRDVRVGWHQQRAGGGQDGRSFSSGLQGDEVCLGGSALLYAGAIGSRH